MFGLILVILGVLVLLEKMNIIQGDFWGFFWPVVLIVLGLNMMKKDGGNMPCCKFFSSKKHNTHQADHHKVVDEQ